jgi:hypothetical protein
MSPGALFGLLHLEVSFLVIIVSSTSVVLETIGVEAAI